MKKTEGQKSRATVPLKRYPNKTFEGIICICMSFGTKKFLFAFFHKSNAKKMCKTVIVIINRLHTAQVLVSKPIVSLG
jgi:hypothetical protein